jgi:hypothetical protein
MSDLLNIPLCRSELLQDFTIHLGMTLASRCNARSVVCKVDTCECDGEELERFSVWLFTSYRTRVGLVLREDKNIWISAALVPELGEGFQVSFYPDFKLLGIARVIEALLETVSISTCLCYDESPEPLMRQIWKYSGPADVEGVI